jgi:hypothetical protein
MNNEQRTENKEHRAKGFFVHRFLFTALFIEQYALAIEH